MCPRTQTRVMQQRKEKIFFSRLCKLNSSLPAPKFINRSSQKFLCPTFNCFQFWISPLKPAYSVLQVLQYTTFPMFLIVVLNPLPWTCFDLALIHGTLTPSALGSDHLVIPMPSPPQFLEAQVSSLSWRKSRLSEYKRCFQGKNCFLEGLVC